MDDKKIDISHLYDNLSAATGNKRKDILREITQHVNSDGYVDDLLREAAEDAASFSKHNRTLTERLGSLTDSQNEVTPRDSISGLPWNILFGNVIIESARELELRLRFMRRQSGHHLKDIFKEEDYEEREANSFYEAAKFNFKRLPEGFNQSTFVDNFTKTSDATEPIERISQFAVYKEGPVVFAITPGEVYIFNDGQLKLGYQNGTGGILSNAFDYKMQWLNQVSDDEGKSFVEPAGNLLKKIHDSESGKSIVSNKWINPYMILANETDYWSQKHDLTPSDYLAELKRREPEISELLSPDLAEIVVREYKDGKSSHFILRSLKRGNNPIGRTDIPAPEYIPPEASSVYPEL